MVSRVDSPDPAFPVSLPHGRQRARVADNPRRSETHWWNDAIESIANGEVSGGPYRDTDIYGNVLAFSNDDGTELDGGQISVRYWHNWIDRARCGISCVPNLSGPPTLDYRSDGRRRRFPFDPYLLYLHRRLVRAVAIVGGGRDGGLLANHGCLQWKACGAC